MVTILTGVGALLVLVECLWVSYGVFARYVLKGPDDMVTEATALLLVPLAFAGMPHALRHDAFPKVTFLIDRLPPRAKTLIDGLNLLLMLLIGAFYTLVAGSAAFRSFRSGSASQIISWPEYVLWAPVALFIGVFTLYGFLKLPRMLSGESGRRRKAE